MKAKHSLLGCLLAALLYALPTAASAQCSGIFNAGEVCGNATASGTLAKNASLTAIFDRSFCGTNNSTTIRLAGTWVCLGLGTNVPAFLTTPSSANLAAALTDETGSGPAVFATAPTITGSNLTTVNTFGLLNSGFNTFVVAGGTNTANRTITVNPVDSDRTLTMSGNINVGGGFSTAGVLGLPAVVQGDVWYGSASGIISALAKDANATRYLANTGTTNNPAWAQINLANGVTGALPLSSLATISADFLVGNFTGSTAAPSSAAIGNCSNALTYSTSTHTFGCNTSGGTGSVTAGAGGIVPTSGSPATLYVEQMTPAGRLTVVSGGCNVSTDQVAQTTLYYAPCGGEWIPVYDGTDMKLRQFTSSTTDTVGLSISMASSAQWTNSVLYDAFVGLDTGTLRLCTGPAWSNSLAGTGARGTGAGTTELQLFKGLWTNKNSMTCRYGGASTFTCAVNQCTYVGTVLIGLGNGTIDLKFGTAAAGGGAAKLSVCNFYNRADVRSAVGDTTASWSYTSSTWRVANAGTTQISIVSCMGDNGVAVKYTDLTSPSATSSFQNISIGLNASNAIATRATTVSSSGAPATIPSGVSLTATLDEIVPLGLSTIYAIESADNTHATTFNGQSNPFNYMQLSLSVRM